MHAKQKTETLPCTPGAFPGGLSRTRFYDGMLLTQEHLDREQTFWRMKRRLTNRALGQGVVWGLRLDWDASKRKFLLGPGYALDCCGNDLVLECPQEVAEHTLIDKHDPKVKSILSGQPLSPLKCPEPESDLPRKACITLNYVECAGDPQPIYEDDCTSNVTHCEYSSVRESTKLCLAPPPAAPPPTLLDAFCKRLEALKQECADLAPDCTLFDMDATLASDEFPVFIEYRNLDTSVAPVQVRPLIGDETPDVGAPIVLPEPGHRVQVSIRPAPGYVIVSGELTTSDGNRVEFLPFGAEFVADWEEFSGAGPAFTISNLRVGCLLSNRGDVQAGLALSISQDAAPTFRVASFDYLSLPAAPTCNDALQPGLIFRSDPNCAMKAVALVALCGWFKGLLANEPNAAPNGKHLAAWWVCRLAWKLLFGANLDEDKNGVLADALKDLLEEWCAAFIYPGPYCENDHHGVYLGCVELSDKGKILSFDPWAHRRYVLTGPLLTYWGGLIGLAPVDVVVGRLAKWICCLSTSQSPAIPGDLASALIDGLPLDDSGKVLVAGGPDEVTAHLDKYRLSRAGEVRTLSLIEFAVRMANQSPKFIGRFDTASQLHTARRIFKLEGTNLHLLEPSPPARLEPALGNRDAVINLLARRTESLRPLARDLVRDYAVEIAREVELTGFDEVEDDAAMAVFVNEIGKEDIVTVHDFFRVGPKNAAMHVASDLEEFEEFDNERDVLAVAERLAVVSETLLDNVVLPFADNLVVPEGELLEIDKLTKSKTAGVIGRIARVGLRRGALTDAKLVKIAKRIAKRRGDE